VYPFPLKPFAHACGALTLTTFHSIVGLAIFVFELLKYKSTSFFSKSA
jgi:hypothetical protein